MAIRAARPEGRGAWKHVAYLVPLTTLRSSPVSLPVSKEDAEPARSQCAHMLGLVVEQMVSPLSPL